MHSYITTVPTFCIVSNSETEGGHMWNDQDTTQEDAQEQAVLTGPKLEASGVALQPPEEPNEALSSSEGTCVSPDDLDAPDESDEV